MNVARLVRLTVLVSLVTSGSMALAMERDPFAPTPNPTPVASPDAESVIGEVRFGATRIRYVRDATGRVSLQTSAAERPAAEADPNAASDDGGEPRLAVDQRFDIDFDPVDAKTLLAVLAHLVGENLVVAGDIDGDVSLHLEDVTFQQVLDLVLFSHALDVHREGNVMLIAPEQALAAYRQARLKNDRDVEALVALDTRQVSRSRSNRRRARARRRRPCSSK